MIPRQEWLKKRVEEVIKQLEFLKQIEDWAHYRKMALQLSSELSYAVTEWENCYDE